MSQKPLITAYHISYLSNFGKGTVIDKQFYIMLDIFALEMPQ